MAAVTALLAGLLYLAVRDAPPGMVLTARSESPREIGAGLLEILRNRQLRLVCALQLVSYPGAITIVGLWGGPYLAQVHGLDAIDRGNALMLMTAAMLVGAIAYGFVDGHVASRKRLLIGGTLAGTAVLTVAAFVPGPPLWLVIVLLTLYVGLVGGSVNVLHAHARAVLPDRLVGRGLTLQNAAAIGGVFLVQGGTGLLVGADALPDGTASESAYRLVFATLAAATLVGIAVYGRADPVAARQPAAAPA
jgi:sugar phosphate permease